ncbi:MAG TPA: S8 family serine peptidase [Phycisphaerae bacterium]|nr:S8 family serine peptidase [Phycisphaerae bacterium]HRW54152.1 S8 family serine peptidase [Phycisphaerae bacterium]
MRSPLFASLAVIITLSGIPAHANDLQWTQLSLSSSKVDQYLKAHPDRDGRGIVIAILDTGVEVDVPGLQKTSTGEVKVIDVQDFSGEGDVEIRRALWSEDNQHILDYDKDGAPREYTPPAEEHRPAGTTLWFGVLREKTFQNSSVRDLNDNGSTSDEFAFCVVSKDDGTDDDAVCFVDQNLDRSFADEKPMRNYRLSFDTLTFHRDAPEKETEPLTIELNIFMSQRKVVFHFDDGGHGTHVAGIAAGYRIQGQDGFNGVAPGAKVISLKLGHNSLAGGATTTGSKKKAIEYAARYARENNVTVVCNLSYGIGSIREGHADIDNALNNILRANPGLIFCTSAGNEGPGLSCVGSPAAARSAITVAALLAVDTAADIRAEKIDAPQLTQFSSRGGELCKPDIATPGMMTSTVPKWTKRGDFWQGTSMASPYATGLSAILAQNLREAGVAPRSNWIKRALKASAMPIPGFTTLDFGAGLPDLPKAVELVLKIADANKDNPLFDIDISVESPLAVDGRAEAAYWRTAYPPTDRDVAFRLTPVFAPTADATTITAFSKRLTLSCDADWCRIEQDQIYFRSEQTAEVRARYDASKLTKPGLYTATITGVADGVPLLRLVNSVVVPHRVDASDDYTLRLENQSVRGWVVNRHYVEVPAGATAMHVRLKAIDGKPSTAQMYYIFMPDGRKATGRYPVRLDTNSDTLESSATINDKLTPGIWELPVTCAGAAETSHYALEVRFDGVHAEPQIIDELAGAPGHTASGDVTFTNVFDRPLHVTMSGAIEGEREVVTKKASPDDDKVEVNLKMTSDIRAARIHVRMSEKDYAKTTDCGINVYDPKGKAISQEGLASPEVTFTTQNPSPGADTVTCKLAVMPAFAHYNTEDKVEFEITIEYLYMHPINIAVKQGRDASLTLYPGVPARLEYKLDRSLGVCDKKRKRFGEIRATEKRSNAVVATVDVLEK